MIPEHTLLFKWFLGLQKEMIFPSNDFEYNGSINECKFSLCYLYNLSFKDNLQIDSFDLINEVGYKNMFWGHTKKRFLQYFILIC